MRLTRSMRNPAGSVSLSNGAVSGEYGKDWTSWLLSSNTPSIILTKYCTVWFRADVRASLIGGIEAL